MRGLDRRVTETLDTLVPPRPGPTRWDAILEDAGAPTARRRSRWARRVAVVGVAAAALLALVLASPWERNEGGTVVERALAAVGDGRVVHMITRDEWGGTLVHLRTGKRTRMHGQREVWYDRARGMHEVVRFGGVVQYESLYSRDELAPHLEKSFAALAGGYRDALAAGRARVLDVGEVDGIPVYWIRVHAEMLPDVADNRVHEWAHDVALSRETYEPVYFRETRDGKPGPDTGARVLEFELLPAGEGDFTASQASLDGTAHSERSERISVAEAARVMDRPALWLGNAFVGLPLAKTLRSETRIGRVERVRLDITPAEARARFEREREERRACAGRIRQARAGSNDTPGELQARIDSACKPGPATLGSFEIRGNVVYRSGPTTWHTTAVGVRLTYTNAPQNGPMPAPDPASDDPYVELEQTTDRDAAFGGGPRGWVPPEGPVLVVGTRFGHVYRDGVYVLIHASSEQLLLAAARALEPVPVT